jgi:hypothetical protein
VVIKIYPSQGGLRTTRMFVLFFLQNKGDKVRRFKVCYPETRHYEEFFNANFG